MTPTPTYSRAARPLVGAALTLAFLACNAALGIDEATLDCTGPDCELGGNDRSAEPPGSSGSAGATITAGLALGLVFGPRAVDAVVMDQGGANGP